MSECWIFGGGYVGDYSCINVPSDAFIIAADSGLIHIAGLGLNPDLIVGDFDSYTNEVADKQNIIKLPVRKDDTDMMFAVKKALELGYKEIILCGALGGRLDHTYANIQTLEYISVHGGNGRIVSDSNIVMFQKNGTKSYPAKDGWYFSLFSFSDEADISLKGTSYTLDSYKLTRSFPLGVSNEITEEFAEVTVESGCLIIMYSKK